MPLSGTAGPCDADASNRKEADMDDEGTLSIALFSGTDDKLSAAALLAAGAAAIGRKVDILLQYWALDAFRAGELTKEHGLAPEAGWDGAQAMRRLQEEGGGQHWSEVLSQAKQLGDVHLHACSLSMDMLVLKQDDLDPMVDDVEGVTAFMLAADGQLVFI
jgi:peroxiredoxin family protein